MKSRSNLESFEIVRISAGSVTTTTSVMPGKYVRFMLGLIRIEVIVRGSSLLFYVFCRFEAIQADERIANMLQTANGGVVSEFSRLEIMCLSVRPIERAMREPRMDPQSTVFPAQPCRP